jgi:hypothetical protein
MIRVDQSKMQALADAKRVAELKELLATSDYKAMPDYDKPDAALLAQRQAWREEIRALTEAQSLQVSP